jgi:hypothetical protein
LKVNASGGARRPGTWLMAAVLFALPTAVYWNTIFHRYAFRDDYSLLRESHEEAGKILRFCTAQGRPVYGAILEHSLALLQGIDGLRWLRLLSALLLGALAVTLFALLVAAEWDMALAALVGVIVLALPAAQILVSWSICWPLILAALLALLAFWIAETAFREIKRGPRIGRYCAAVGLVGVSAMIYQPNALFYVAAVAAFWSRAARHPSKTKWFAWHAGAVGAGLALAFAIMIAAFAEHWAPISKRVAFEHDWLGKLKWFVTVPLEDALGLIALNNDAGARTVRYAAIAAVGCLAAGILRTSWRAGWKSIVGRSATLMGLLLASFAVNLLAADRWPMYRVLLPLSTTITVVLAVALTEVLGLRVGRIMVAALALSGVWLARQQAFGLIAWPQGQELTLIEREAEHIDLTQKPSIFVIAPKRADRISAWIFGDEFGSQSADSDWVPHEMMRTVLREKYHAGSEIDARYTFASGHELRTDQKFDVVIDMRRLRELRPRQPGGK